MSTAQNKIFIGKVSHDLFFFQIQHSQIKLSGYKESLIGQAQVTIAKLRTGTRCVCKFSFSLFTLRIVMTKHGICGHSHDLVLKVPVLRNHISMERMGIGIVVLGRSPYNTKLDSKRLIKPLSLIFS